MTARKPVSLIVVLTASSLLCSVGGSGHEIKAGSIVIVHPWASAIPGSPDEMGGFMKIKNEGQVDDRLISVTFAPATKVELGHMTADGKAQFLTNGILLPAGGVVEFSATTYLMRFEGIKSRPSIGEEIEGTLQFEKAGTVKVDFEVSAQPQ